MHVVNIITLWGMQSISLSQNLPKYIAVMLHFHFILEKNDGIDGFCCIFNKHNASYLCLKTGAIGKSVYIHLHIHNTAT